MDIARAALIRSSKIIAPIPTATTIFANNPYLRPDIAGQVTAAGQNSFQIGRMFNDIPVMHQRSVTRFFSGQATLKGKLGGNWGWDANYVHGQSTLDFSASEWTAACSGARGGLPGRVDESNTA